MSGLNVLPPFDDLRGLRIQEIENILRKQGAVTIADLARQFDKTPVTIRRDLLLLEHKGLVKRIYGGAIAVEVPRQDVKPYHVREAVKAGEKSAIAHKAAEFVKDGDSLIINAGTTMQAFARELCRFKNLQVVTNGVTVVSELAQAEGAQVILVGGEVDLRKLGAVGPLAEESLQNVHVAKAFLAMAAISATRGVSMHTHGHARLNQRFVQSADEITVLIDSSKFETHSLFHVASMTEVHRVITDSNAPTHVCDAIRRKGVDVVIVERI